MANVVAKSRGYFAKVLREPGEVFSVPDDIMDDPKMRPSWVKSLDRSYDVTAADAPEPAKTQGKRKAKAETVTAPVAEPFADAPEPVRVVNEVNDATGGTQPDWLAPGDDI